MSWIDNKDDFYNDKFEDHDISNDLSIFRLNQKTDYSIDLDDYKLPSTSKGSILASDVNQNIFKERTYIDGQILDGLRVENKHFYSTESEGYKQQRERTKMLLKKTRRDERGSEMESVSFTTDYKEDSKKREKKKKKVNIAYEGMSPDSLIKLKNREAAQKSRQKKQNEFASLMEKEHKLEEENLLLKSELEKLKESVRNCSNCRSILTRPVLSDSGITSSSKKCILVTGIFAMICIITTIFSTPTENYIAPTRVLQSFNNSEYNNEQTMQKKKKADFPTSRKCHNNFLSNVAPPVHYHEDDDPSPLRINMDISKENISLFCDDCYFTLNKTSYADFKQTVKVFWTLF
jgi:hypothetical protein